MPQEAFSEQEGSNFVDWLLRRVIVDGRGDEYRRLPVRPEGRFWLGRLTPEAVVQTSRRPNRSAVPRNGAREVLSRSRSA